MAEFEDRIKDLEAWRHLKDIEFALIKQSVTGIQSSLDKINGNVSKLVWLIVVALLGGFLTFVMRGGLNIT